MEDNSVLDFRIAAWRRDPLTREPLDAISALTDDERLVLLNLVTLLLPRVNLAFVSALAAELRNQRKG